MGLLEVGMLGLAVDIIVIVIEVQWPAVPKSYREKSGSVGTAAPSVSTLDTKICNGNQHFLLLSCKGTADPPSELFGVGSATSKVKVRIAVTGTATHLNRKKMDRVCRSASGATGTTSGLRLPDISP